MLSKKTIPFQAYVQSARSRAPLYKGEDVQEHFSGWRVRFRSHGQVNSVIPVCFGAMLLLLQCMWACRRKMHATLFGQIWQDSRGAQYVSAALEARLRVAGTPMSSYPW